MGIIKASKVVFEYIRRDEEGNVDSIQTAVDHVDLDVKEGDFVVILGHNGSGKSTLAKQLNALLVPSEGTLWVDGKDTKERKNVRDVRRKAGMVFQNPDNQIIASVVEEDVGFGPENLGVPTEEIWKRVGESLTSVGMLKFRRHSPNKLSGGQKQKIAIASVLVMKPELLLLDEPVNGLDFASTEYLYQLIAGYKEHGTVLFSSHILESVTLTSDRVLVLENGKIQKNFEQEEIDTAKIREALHEETHL